MFSQYGTEELEAQSATAESQRWAEQLEAYLRPYRERWDAYLDSRVVGNLTAAVAGILQTRSALTLSEVGSTLCGPAHAEAGSQRLQRAMHHQGWKASLIEQVMLEQAEAHHQQIEQAGDTPLCVWDGSVLEKPESRALEGLGSVRSSRVRRLARSRAGLFNRPGVPVSVRGFEWESVLLVGLRGVPYLAATRWWSREKSQGGQQRQVQASLLRQVAGKWGRRVCHIFDRGYGTAPWLAELSMWRVRFVVRWKKGNKLLDRDGQSRKAWQIPRGKRSWGESRSLWDRAHRGYRQTQVVAVPVHHPDYQGDLWLVVVRQGKGREPWYLLTNEPVESSEQAWQIALSYARRWQIEESFRFEKSELDIESVRLQAWEPRCKWLMLLTLAHGFLLSLLAPCRPLLLARARLVRHWGQRADWRQWKAKTPLYRLRWALSRLWLTHPPTFSHCQPYRPLTHVTWPPGSFRWWTTLWHLSGYVF